MHGGVVFMVVAVGQAQGCVLRRHWSQVCGARLYVYVI